MTIIFTDNDRLSAMMKGKHEKNDGETIRLARKK